MWDYVDDTHNNCAGYNHTDGMFKLIKCGSKQRYFCKVSSFHSFILGPTYMMTLFQIEISFPSSCVNPTIITNGTKVRPFHRKFVLNKTKINEQVQALSNYLEEEIVTKNLNKTNQEPGKPFYFKCGKKKYKAILKEVYSINFNPVY